MDEKPLWAMTQKLKLMRALAVGIVFLFSGCGHGQEDTANAFPQSVAPFEPAQRVGKLQNPSLIECSGLDASPSYKDLFWAVNDSGDEPVLYAVGFDGQSFGQVRVEGGKNRDWEDLATFVWQGQSMILLADAGDNMESRPSHTLYVVREPEFKGRSFDADAKVKTAWQIVFTYPDKGHDVEAVGVDAVGGKVLLLTKRDKPPLLFELPLTPAMAQAPATARLLTAVTGIPAPSGDDLFIPYGKIRSQPTAMDISADGRQAVVLTYKNAYLFERRGDADWAAAFGADPMVVPLPLPEDTTDLLQREAACFSPDDAALFVTSEGKKAGIYRLNRRQ